MAEFASDAEQLGSVGRAEDDAIAAQLAAEDRHLGLEEPDADVAARGEALKKEVQ
jgi:hypothetical protein